MTNFSSRELIFLERSGSGGSDYPFSSRPLPSQWFFSAKGNKAGVVQTRELPKASPPIPPLFDVKTGGPFSARMGGPRLRVKDSRVGFVVCALKLPPSLSFSMQLQDPPVFLLGPFLNRSLHRYEGDALSLF